MKIRHYHILLILLLAGSGLRAQNRVEIFADTQGNDSLQKLVTLLMQQLKKALPVEYTVKPSGAYAGKGIYIGLVTASSKVVKTPRDLLTANIEAYSIQGDASTVQILARCNMALSHGVFSYLDFIGYRFYFANKDWHIVPAKPKLFQKINIISQPSFNHRRIWYGYGTGSKIADDDYNFWIQANKLGGSINASFGHSYGNIIARNREEFKKHPEWFYPKGFPDKLTEDEKFDVSNEELIQLLIKDTEKEIELSLRNNTSAYKMISLAPADGLGTCNSPACQKLGTITDRVYYPVNRVAKAIRAKYPSTLIGCLAYGEYIAPPTKKLEANVFVGITTAFNSTKLTTAQLVEQWSKKGAVVGIYDYFSWYAWDADLPGRSLASRVTEMIKNIKQYYANGVTAYEGESSQGWISKGLGYYLAARQMWNVRAETDMTKEEFFNLCFENVAGTMRKLWDEWENNSFNPIREGDLARWIDYAKEADRNTTSNAVRKRIYQVKSYLHYLHLYRIYQLANSEANLLSVLQYGYRKLDDGSVAGFPAFYELGNKSGIEGMAYSDKAKWRTSAGPVGADELNRLLDEDRKKLVQKTAVATYTAPVKFMNVPNLDRYQKMIADSAQNDNKWLFDNEWVIEIKKKGKENYLTMRGDYIGNSSNTKPITVGIYPYKADGNITGMEPLVYYEYTASQVDQRIGLFDLAPGYYTMIILDPVKVFKLDFSPAINFSQLVRPNRPIKSTAINYAFIYVPEDVKKFNVIKSKLIEFVTPTGRSIPFLTDKSEEVQIEVLKGEAGLWRVKSLYDQVYFEGIPPVISTSPKQMLIPGNK